MYSHDRLLSAIDDALAAAASDAPASTVARLALRVAMLREDIVAQFWLRLELEGVGSTEMADARRRPLQARLVALVGEAEAHQAWSDALEGFIARRTLHKDQNQVMGHGAATLELIVSRLQDGVGAQIQATLGSAEPGATARTRDRLQAKTEPQILQNISILDRLRNAAYTYVLEAEPAVLAGIVPSALARGQLFAEEMLARRAPDALEALRAAESNAASGNRESASLAATSCRRAVKAMADALYPVGQPVVDNAGTKRSMDDQHSRNRLTQFVLDRRGRSTLAGMLSSNIEMLGTRLKSLDDLASKGVHSDLARNEIEACISSTWALATDLLRIDEEADHA